jgi:hypothetical protein
MILMMPLPGFSLPQKPCPRLQHQKMKSARFLNPPLMCASIYPITKETGSCERIFLEFFVFYLFSKPNTSLPSPFPAAILKVV